MPLDGNGEQIEANLRREAKLAACMLACVHRNFEAGEWRWIQGDMFDGKNSFCMFGGVFTEAVRMDHNEEMALAYIAYAILSTTGGKKERLDREVIITYNDNCPGLPSILNVLSKAKQRAEDDARAVEFCH